MLRIGNVGLAFITISHLSNAMAGGFAVSSVGARGAAMQAFTAVADDESAIYYNPAGLTQIKDEAIMTGGEFIFPQIKYTNSITQQTIKSSRSAIGGHLFYVKPYKEKWRFGIGVYSPFARLTRYPTGPSTQNARLNAFIRRIDVVPTASMQLTDSLSVGISGVLSHIKVENDAVGLQESGNGYGLTGQAGVLWKINKSIRLGASYRGQENSNIKGKGTFSPANAKGNYNFKLKMPGVISVGLAAQVHPKVLASIEYNNEMWSCFDMINKNYDNPIFKPLSKTVINGKNSANYRGGLSININEKSKLYGGYTYSDAAIPVNNTLPTMPEFVMDVYAVGVSHQAEKFRVDFAYEYSNLRNNTKTQGLFTGSTFGHGQRVFVNVSIPV